MASKADYDALVKRFDPTLDSWEGPIEQANPIDRDESESKVTMFARVVDLGSCIIAVLEGTGEVSQLKVTIAVLPHSRRAKFSPNIVEHQITVLGGKTAPAIAAKLKQAFLKCQTESIAVVTRPEDYEYDDAVRAAELNLERAMLRFALERDKAGSHQAVQPAA